MVSRCVKTRLADHDVRVSIEDNLRTWIDSQGYPLEMRTAEVLRRAGLWWDHGRTYTDPVTGKIREIDLVANLGSDDGNRAVPSLSS
jgi:hypothetical protein